MHRYQPPASASDPRPYYPLGDVLIAGGAAAAAVILGRFRKR
jgi:hypothetical protein